ncbi:hypothetical protein KAU09_02135 [Candidatus Parcubacteria bacterium]|nr:hypothetical protein [Candidatus Parcubacteria bacterium]
MPIKKLLIFLSKHNTWIKGREVYSRGATFIVLKFLDELKKSVSKTDFKTTFTDSCPPFGGDISYPMVTEETGLPLTQQSSCLNILGD